MPIIQLGFPVRNRGASELSVQTDIGVLEPARPSDVRVYLKTTFSPNWSFFRSLIGLFVSILTYPVHSYIHTTAAGLQAKPSRIPLPLSEPSLCVVVSKGKGLSEDDMKYLIDEGFLDSEFQGHTVWQTDECTREQFLRIYEMQNINHDGPTPDKFLNVTAYRGFLVLKSLTSNICALLSLMASDSSRISSNDQRKNSVAKAPWSHVTHPFDNMDTDGKDSEGELTFVTETAFHLSSGSDKVIASMLSIIGAKGVSNTNPGVIANPYAKSLKPFRLVGELVSVRSPGFLFKFNPRLAISDPNLITDVITKHFLSCLGGTIEEQLENLAMLKAAVGNLRLTRVGDELTHLFKCISIAVEGGCGLVPYFTNSVYEGCALGGGPTEGTLIINGLSFPAEPAEDLRLKLSLLSEHSAALSYIADKFPLDQQDSIRTVQSMHGLRAICLGAVITEKDKADIIRKAGSLDFGVLEWRKNAERLSQAFKIISGSYEVSSDMPVTRMGLFSEDRVLLALGMFGEKSAPSWDVPNGTKCSLVKSSPPVPLVQKKGAKGKISDAAWIMTLKSCSLDQAIADFRTMADTLTYRSVSSELARKVKYTVLSKNKVGDLWSDLRGAIRVVNPNAGFEKEGGTKRTLDTDSPQTVEGSSGKKVKLMEF